MPGLRSGLLFMLAAPFAIRSGAAAVCDQPPIFYQKEGYTVGATRIDSPLSFLPTVSASLRKAASGVPVKPGEAFDLGRLTAGVRGVRDSFPPLQVHPYARLAVLTVFPRLENCDPAEKKLDVIFQVFSVNPGGALTRTFELGDKAAGRGVPDAAATRFLRSVQPSAFSGYDQARKLVGGGSFDLKFGDRAGPLDRAHFEGSGSADSALVRADLSGHSEFQSSGIQDLEWSLKYSYSNLPVNLARIQEGSLSLQFLAASRAWGRYDWIGRFGGSVEGGNRQTDPGNLVLAPGEVANAGLGAIKLFAGISAQPGPGSLKASYGIQLGNTTSGRTLDYVKHIADVAHSLRLLPKWHRAITLDSKFTAGLIQLRGVLPFTERFFGGNIEREFIEGASWSIRANPLIRSVPFDRLGGFGRTGSGGDAFQVLNITAGFTVWGKPLVPDAVVRSPGFENAVALQLAFPKATFYDEYLGTSAEFEPFRLRVIRFRDTLRVLGAALAKIEAAQPADEDIEDSVSVTSGKVKRALAKIESKEPAEIVPTDVLALVEDFPATDEDPVPIPSVLTELARSLANLQKLLEKATIFPEQTKVIEEALRQFETEVPATLTSLRDLEKSAAGRKAKALAERDMRFPTRVLNTLLRDVNLAGISPVVLFDAARIQQRSLNLSRTLSSIGGGLKFSFIVLDLTGAYAWNPDRKPGEPPGAFVFALEIADLFR